MAAIHGLVFVSLVAVGLLSGAEAAACKNGQAAKMFAVLGSRDQGAGTEYAYPQVVVQHKVKWDKLTITSKKNFCEVKASKKGRRTITYVVKIGGVVQGCVATCEWHNWTCDDPRTSVLAWSDGEVAQAVYAGKKPVKFKTSGKKYKCKKVNKENFYENDPIVYEPDGKKSLVYMGGLNEILQDVLVVTKRSFK